ncbi:MAG TPA: 5-oxoprolinase/urea amidolyase family protein [Actinocrinis sp.]|nr:5-oxoprolinase/urea amidolyase family protein [Actinocrinis sp.]
MTARLEVLDPGVQTTVQDLRGRRGLWGVGVPPSGAFDDRSFALANAAVGNDPGAAGLEVLLTGPRVRMIGAEGDGDRGAGGSGSRGRVLMAVAGACSQVRLNGRPVAAGVPFSASVGDVVEFGACGPGGLRGYLAVCGGISVPRVLGSRATFLLGRFGGTSGRALIAGDVLHMGREENCGAPADCSDSLPELGSSWQLRVIPGPHGAPEYFTDDALADLFAARWTVDHRSDRTGIRLVGPPVRFARPDGGEAGLHPCNIHDSAYPIGGIMVSGDTPVIVGPDGPSLGGFVVPAAVVRADLWKLGQLRPGDTVRLAPATAQAQAQTRARTQAQVSHAQLWQRPDPLLTVPPSGDRPGLVVRLSGDHHVLVEAGPPRLDLTVRARIHLLAQEIERQRRPGITESVEGVRSLLLTFEPAAVAAGDLAALTATAWRRVPDPRGIKLAVREVTLPICFDDPDAHEAMRRYQRGVRPDAPWCPDNVEFIRRVNGLAARSDVFDVVRAATYLVVGLGDVYLGAPVAVPLDPAHRLVTTKYDPPRTWTPENAVGIGGAYLCVYGMEGPGGYQLVGRTVPVWRKPSADSAGERRPKPWLLRTFDLLRFEPVSHERLIDLRERVAKGTMELTMRESTLDLGALPNPDAPLPPEAREFTDRRVAAFAEERQRWADRAAHAAVGAAP